MDERSFQQEYEASFLTQTGLVFYKWDRAKHLRDVRYDPNLPLVFCFDFNVSPGAAVVAQEQFHPGAGGKQVQTTCIIGEFFRRDDSNTPLVCAYLADKYRGHQGMVRVYGDVGGHQRRTSAKSTDWQVVREELEKSFRDVRICVGRAAPSVVDSVNMVNSRLETTAGAVHVAVSPSCEHTVKDFEGVVWDERKADRDIDKRDGMRTHWADALRYYISDAFPLNRASAIY